MKFSKAMEAVTHGKIVSRKGEHKFYIGIVGNRMSEMRREPPFSVLSLYAQITKADTLADDWEIVDLSTVRKP